MVEQVSALKRLKQTGVLQKYRFGGLGPSRAGTPAAGTCVCRPAGMSKILPLLFLLHGVYFTVAGGPPGMSKGLSLEKKLKCR